MNLWGLHGKRGRNRLLGYERIQFHGVLLVGIVRVLLGRVIETGASILLVRIHHIGAVPGKRHATPRLVVEVICANARHQRTVGRIVEILGFLPHAIMAGILKAAFNASLARPLVTYRYQSVHWVKQREKRLKRLKTYRKSDERVDRQNRPSLPSSSADATGPLG